MQQHYMYMYIKVQLVFTSHTYIVYLVFIVTKINLPVTCNIRVSMYNVCFMTTDVQSYMYITIHIVIYEY